MGSRVRVPYTPQTLPKVQCFRKCFALYVIYILAKFKSCFDRLQSGKTQTCKRTQAQALPLMRATRPEVVEKYSDARRVAPISVSVSSSTKRYHQTLPLMGATRLASGIFFSSLVSRERCSYYLVEFVFPSHFSIPMNAGRVTPISESVWCLCPFVCLRFARRQKSLYKAFSSAR